jgi:hypothetical protein
VSEVVVRVTSQAVISKATIGKRVRETATSLTHKTATTLPFSLASIDRTIILPSPMDTASLQPSSAADHLCVLVHG